MRLKTVEAAWFRGFQDPDPINIDSDLVILEGPNGSGKTSIAEAIEWVLFGDTQRHKYASVDEVEKRGSFRNVKCPNSEDPWVEIIFERDGSSHTLRRTLERQDRTTLELDGTTVAHLAQFNIPESRQYYPVVVQDNLQAIIQASGSERRNVISRLLGLEPLVDLESVLDSAARRFLDRLPPRFSRAVTDLRELRDSFRREDILPTLVEEWDGDAVRFPENWNVLRREAADVLEVSDTSPDTLQTAAEDALADARRRVVDISPYQPPDDLSHSLSNLSDLVDELDTAFEDLQQTAATYLEERSRLFRDAAETFDPDRIGFWQTGLGLIDTELLQSEKRLDCPFCEEPTITDEKVELIGSRISESESFASVRDRISESVDEIQIQLSQVETLVSEVTPTEIDEDTLVNIGKLQTDAIETARSLNKVTAECDKEQRHLVEHVNELAQGLSELTDALDNPERHEEAAAFVGSAPEVLRESLQSIRQSTIGHSEIFQTLDTQLNEVVVTDDEVRQAQTVVSGLQSRDVIRDAAAALDTAERIRHLRSALRDFQDRKHREELAARGEEIRRWFRLLYDPDPEILDFARVEPSGTVMRLLARVLGEERHASTHLSQSQLNCLGLGLHVVSSTVNQCPFGFVLFDDPIQSFDDEIREQFLGRAVSELIDAEEKQVIVFTHLSNLAHRLNYGNVSRRPILLKAKRVNEEGLSISETNPLRRDIQDIRRRGRGDDIERDVACQRMRRFNEHLCKAIYQSCTGTRIPIGYEDASGSDLVVLVESLGVLSGADLDLVRDTVYFGTPPSHDDPEWAAPNTRSIALRMDQLERIARECDLV